ncbi:putative U-box domain-containing protein 42 isoform X2 [Beta vulgaris subsp. vulgaris]|uniref:putative U-box domain-containing protein 42 isoform X2 n=1 Tax=Beta vulgaris subsp. vulgaris TaxID=3555 RepID=UPI002036C3AF|nr:putative U-box domain-containing protein 42 isoform X2 [Beta vulgaris subsp. vulgaris]
MELQTSESSPANENEILRSLSQNTDLAKGILGEFQQNGQTIMDHEVRNIIKRLEEIINDMGHDLSLIPPSAFQNEVYAKNTIRSLSEEMKNVCFEIIPVQKTKNKKKKIKPLSPVEQPKVESITLESDLYSISMEVSTGHSQVSDIPPVAEALRSTSESSQRPRGNMSNRLSKSVTEGAQHMEPMYKSFICQLTNQVMDDPVTISSGVTYERSAITEYFENCGNSEEVNCPITQEKLQSRNMSPNLALRNIIHEWRDRNDSARLKVIRAALSIGSTESMILEALKDLQNICQRSPKKKKEVFNMGIVPLIVRLLELRDRSVRCTALEMIRQLVEEDDAKEQFARTPVISTTIKMLSSSYQPIRHAALLLLIEFSKSRSLAEKIGCVTGGTLVLIQTKYNRFIDTFASEAADQVLKNMEQCTKNIKFMAENGYLEPLLNNLIEGSEERKLEMMNYLGEIILEDDSKTYVAERTSPVLIQMLHDGNPSTRKAVFKALVQISSYSASGKLLVEAGIVGTMVQEMFTKKIYSEPVDSLKEASAILANILESGIGFENLIVNSQGHTLVSDYVVFNIIYMIKSSTPDDLSLNLIRILYCMAKSKKSENPVVSAVKENEASYTLVELINNPSDEIVIAAIKLLTLLSSHIGHLLIDRLCKTNGQPEGLIQSPSNPSQITERQALSISFLAKLPHQNLTLNVALTSKNTIPGILQSINQLQRSGTQQNRYACMYFEGLVGVLVRFTATLYDPQMLFLAINHNFTAVLTNLLMETSRDEVQTLAATGLEKLSTQSTRLSKPPQRKQKKFFNLFYLPRFLTFRSSRKAKVELCVVHRGVCTEQTTFCLIEAGTIERLLTCLDHQNVEVADAALSALSTLLDDKVDVEQSVNMLDKMNATQRVLKAVRYHKNEILWQKAFWMIERFLVKGGQRSLSLVSQDKLFYITVVTAFHHGDAYTRQMAENILRYLDKMPSLTGTFTT